jgi:preprotein translocase subunit SecF
MLHDVFIVLGIFAILGKLVGTEIDSLFVTAVLTVIGFSVHDTIVVFDRIRENQIRRPAMPFDDVVNYSLNQTIVRSINTSLTVVFTLLALVLFGGATIREFVLALLLGVVSGTYSSIFNASQLLVSWERGEIQRLAFWRRGRGTSRAATSGAGD